MKKTVRHILFLLLTLAFLVPNVSAQNNIASDDLPFTLYSPNPNPFKEATTLQYTLRKSGFVTIKVYNLLGNEVGVIVNENKNSGTYFSTFEAKNLPKGIYFCRFSFGNYSSTQKLIIAD